MNIVNCGRKILTFSLDIVIKKEVIINFNTFLLQM